MKNRPGVLCCFVQIKKESLPLGRTFLFMILVKSSFFFFVVPHGKKPSHFLVRLQNHSKYSVPMEQLSAGTALNRRGVVTVIIVIFLIFFSAYLEIPWMYRKLINPYIVYRQSHSIVLPVSTEPSSLFLQIMINCITQVVSFFRSFSDIPLCKKKGGAAERQPACLPLSTFPFNI